MSARSLFDTFFRMGMTKEEAYEQCVDQQIFAEDELEQLRMQERCFFPCCA